MSRRVQIAGCLLFCLAAIGSVSSPAWSAQAVRIQFDPGIRAMVLEAISQSTQQIDVEVYKMTDRGVIAGLGKAAKKGLKVRVILCPTQESNHKAALRLVRDGVEVRWYPIRKKNQIMHVKMGLFDRKRLIFGSPNWTYWGLTLHHEGVLDVALRDTVREMEAQFEEDWTKSRP